LKRLALALLAGCPESRPATERTPIESPAPASPSAPAPSDPLVESAPVQSAIERAEGRVVVTTTASAEEILLVPGGVVWTEGGDVRAVFADDDAPRVLATLTDPHALATDGRSVVWLGDQDNGRYELATASVTALPEVAGPGQQEGLAFGDALYARSRPDALWRIDGVGGKRPLSVVRLPFHPDAAWKLVPGFAAAKRVLYVPVADRSARGQYALVRFATAGKSTAIPLQRLPAPFTWSVDADGDVVLVADDRGTIARIGVRERDASVLFVHPGAEQVCWCGADVCMFTATGHVARRGPSTAEARPVADDAEGALAIACGRDRVAWTSAREPDGSRITVVELR